MSKKSVDLDFDPSVFDEVEFLGSIDLDSDSDFSTPPIVKKKSKKEMLRVEELETLFGRKAREGYYLQLRSGMIIEHLQANQNPKNPLPALLCFIGNGVEVEIRDSTIPNSGKGLFLKKGLNSNGSVSAGTLLCPYDGIRVNYMNNGLTYLLKQKTNDYIWRGLNHQNKCTMIDAKDPNSCYGRYANDALSTRNNAEIDFVSRSTYPKVILRATKNIKLGEEIFVSYGEEYWKSDPEKSDINTLRQAWKYYKISDPFPELPVPETPKPELITEPSVEPMVEPVLQSSAEPFKFKRSGEDLIKDYYSKKRALLQIKMELIDLEELVCLENVGVNLRVAL